MTNSSSGQSEDVVLGYEAFQFGARRDSWSPGFYQGSLGKNVNRYITNGASASAPSENLGFYFSGMHAPGWGEVHYEDSSATVPSNTMIQVDMSAMREEKWANFTLPDEITPRANAELIWLPVSDRGVLVAIGGVTQPEEIYPTGLNESQRSRSEAVSPSFMTSIPIYDVASETWFVQNTSGSQAPPQLTEFCSVLAVDSNTSTYNIYIYGGYGGIDADDIPSDDVWVLSLPSFTWTKVHEGSGSHGRSGHHCISPYPDKMFVIGGVHQNQAECLEGGFIQIFNLNKMEFQNTYHPDKWDQYEQPSSISTSNNRAKKRQVQWANPELEKIFTTKYTKDIPRYYPFESSGDISSGPSGSESSGSSTNKTAIAVGVSIGVLILALTIALIWLLRRKGMLRSTSSVSSRTKRSRVSKWIIGTRGSPSHGKSFGNDSASDINGEIAQQYSNASATVSSEASSSTPIVASNRPYRAPQEMAAVDRPHPPFELATPYNSDSHPRNSTAVDYAYQAQKGHSSRSTSSEYGKLPTNATLSAQQVSTPYDDLVREARASVDLADTEHPTASVSDDNDTTSTTSSTGWPLPKTRSAWARSPTNASDPNNASPAERQHLLGPPTSVTNKPHHQYRSLSRDSTPDRLRPILPDAQVSDSTNTTTTTSSISQPSTRSPDMNSAGQQSTNDTSIVSPITGPQLDNDGWEPQKLGMVPARKPVQITHPQQPSLMEGVIVSPVSPEQRAVVAPWESKELPQGRRNSGEGRERWWE